MECLLEFQVSLLEGCRKTRDGEKMEDDRIRDYARVRASSGLTGRVIMG